MNGVFNNIQIQGISSAVPSTIEKNDIYSAVIGERRVKKQIKLTGVSQRHISLAEQMPSDLCYAAAQKLLKHLNWDLDQIKVLVFITQRPNFKLPSTAFFLQKRLNLSKDCVCFDINLGCSSFNVGVQTVSSLLQTCNIHDKALLLVGDTASLVRTPDSTYKADEIAHDMLFGAEGSCIAIEKVDNNNVFFTNYSDGEGYKAIYGEFNESSKMDGSAVFSFAIDQVSNTVKEFRDKYDLSDDKVDFYVFHQAQQLILDSIIEICGIPGDKELRSLYEYGNTSGGSVPLTLNANYEKLQEKQRANVLFCGFGVGLSWGCIYTSIPTENILPVIVSDDHYRDERSLSRQVNNKGILIYGADTDMGEWLSKYSKKRGGRLILVGRDLEKLNSVKDGMIDKPLVISSDDCLNEIEAADPIDGIVLLEEMTEQQFINILNWIDASNDSQRQVSIVLCYGYSSNEERKLIIEKAEGCFKTVDPYSKVRINAVIYNKSTVDMRLGYDSGQKWTEEYILKECPDEMAKASYISVNVLHYISNSTKYTNHSVLTVD